MPSAIATFSGDNETGYLGTLDEVVALVVAGQRQEDLALALADQRRHLFEPGPVFRSEIGGDRRRAAAGDPGGAGDRRGRGAQQRQNDQQGQEGQQDGRAGHQSGAGDDRQEAAVPPPQ